jgi:hypothetical protein
LVSGDECHQQLPSLQRRYGENSRSIQVITPIQATV